MFLSISFEFVCIRVDCVLVVAPGRRMCCTGRSTGVRRCSNGADLQSDLGQWMLLSQDMLNQL